MSEASVPARVVAGLSARTFCCRLTGIEFLGAKVLFFVEVGLSTLSLQIADVSGQKRSRAALPSLEERIRIRRVCYLNLLIPLLF